MSMDIDRIEAVLRLLSRQGHVEELQVESESFRLSVRRLPGLAPMGEPEPSAESAPPRPHIIQAPRVGVFRAAATPLIAGTHVATGDVVGSLESMRILNPITAEEAGWIEEVFVEDGDPVEFGQSLFVLAPEAVASVSPHE
jgi:acetyl-CoA carboxylase biotin carboxyl carrier protein